LDRLDFTPNTKLKFFIETAGNNSTLTTVQAAFPTFVQNTKNILFISQFLQYLQEKTNK